ncbi:DUF4386 domain-containing protein [Georgenia yuyongxinii]|uniref:DUF4386 domain-containing protein n=1 Tax=Georgenia yuyongxinii TaxID=2589797 RepID=A0A552WV96_9MICO|nr:DUF4386 domain-containing protein [Georgenia yuyongxinii]TRW46625.1 DUF4386 domain-containing protein [Georgenia yuyongxinii]
MSTRRIATLTGWLMVVTFVTSIPAAFLYGPMRGNPSSITGAGADPTAGVALAALLELILIVANVGTAVVPYVVFKRYSEGLALSYVAARLIEAMFIAIGIIAALAFVFMRQEGTAATDPGLGEALVAIYWQAFLIGPGIFAGVANGMILGYLMFRSGLVPRGLAVLGLIGGPLIVITGVAIMFNVIEPGSPLRALATAPEFVWELSFGIYLIVKGFKPSPVLAGMDAAPPGARGARS